jgi:hypothetical protein
MKAQRGVQLQLYLFCLTWGLDEVGGQRHPPTALDPISVMQDTE